jgi:hypothetical protein
VSESGATSLPSLAPVLTYLALAPYIGADAACEAANGAGQGRRSQSAILESTWKIARSRPLKRQVLANIANAGEASVTGIADDLDAPVDLVRAQVDELREEELIEAVEGAEERYRTQLTTIEEEQWSRMSRAQRERISAQIGYLIASEVELAVNAKTFDRRTDRHLTRLEAQVDEPGWEKLRQIHDDTLRATVRVHRECVERLRASGETGVSVRSLQTLFEMPDV